MPTIVYLTLAALTRDIDDAGSDDRLNVTININGIDDGVTDFVGDRGQAQGYLAKAEKVVEFPSASLTNSSIRVGTRGDDAWAPQHILLFGQTLETDVVPLAMETDLTEWMSTDASEGALTIPLRLLAPESNTTLIHRLLVLMRTADEGDAGTDSLVQLQIVANKDPLFSEVMVDTEQDDQEQGASNWYFFNMPVPISRSDLRSKKAEVVLTMLGGDAWRPDSFYLFGLDTASGRPNQLITLVEQTFWKKGWMSSDDSEGRKEARFHA